MPHQTFTLRGVGVVEQTIVEEVMFYDTDCGGVVHNLAYLRMIEKCRTLLAKQIGMDMRAMSESEVYPVIVETQAKYLRPAKLADELSIEGKLTEWGKVRFWCEFEVKRGEEVLVTAPQCLALVQMPAGKVQRLGELKVATA